MRDAFLSAAEMQEVEFIYKPHPREEDLETVIALAHECGCKNFRAIRDDLFLLLLISDVVVVYHSTVGAEAIMFKKPLVVMNHDEADLVGYIKDGVGFEVKTKDELTRHVRGLLDGSIKNFDQTLLDKYSLLNNYVIDGKRTDDLIAFIEKG